ncbi:hypothetical protein CUMW_032390, partial [Citrus unshiu]
LEGLLGFGGHGRFHAFGEPAPMRGHNATLSYNGLVGLGSILAQLTKFLHPTLIQLIKVTGLLWEGLLS